MEPYNPEIVRVGNNFSSFSLDDMCICPLSAFNGKRPNVKSFGISICISESEAEKLETTEELIFHFKKMLKSFDFKTIDFINIDIKNSLKLTRCAVIAVSELTAINIMVSLHAEDDERLSCGASLKAASATLQSMGVSAFIISAKKAPLLENALEDIAPYLRASIGVNMPIDFFENEGLTLWNVTFFVCEGDDFSVLNKKINNFKNYIFIEKESGFIQAPDSQTCHYITPTIDISNEIDCSPHLAEDILEAENNEAGAFKIYISEEDDLVHLEKLQYMFSRPVCFSAENPETLEKALRIFRGRALFDSTFEIKQEVLKYFVNKYGLIVL